jgi:hypothetical protein
VRSPPRRPSGDNDSRFDDAGAAGSRRHRWGLSLRLSVGIETCDDLLEDLAAALSRVAALAPGWSPSWW